MPCKRCGRVSAQGICQECSRKASGYFEGILQLRNKSSRAYQEVLEFAMGMLDEAPCFISKIAQQRDGHDIYASSNKQVIRAGKALAAKWGAGHKVSRKLHHRDHSTQKLMYRVTVLYRLPVISPGDVAVFGKRIVQVKSVKASAVSGIDLESGKKAVVKSLEPDEVLDPFQAEVTKTRPAVEVLDPVDYQSREVANPRKVSGLVRVARFGGRLFLLH